MGIFSHTKSDQRKLLVAGFGEFDALNPFTHPKARKVVCAGSGVARTKLKQLSGEATWVIALARPNRDTAAATHYRDHAGW